MGFVNRRDFLKGAAVSSALAGLSLTGEGFSPKEVFSANTPGFKRIVYRVLGSTGCKVSEIGFGVLHTQDTALIHAAIDSGINFFDTAHGYQNGRCEQILGEVMKTRRKEVIIATKVGVSTPDKMKEKIEISLKRLQTDYVDLLLVHGLGSRKRILNEDIMKLYDDTRRKGMTRFVGFSTHNQVGGLDAAVDSNFWEAVLVPYNYFSPLEVTAAIKRARETGIAIIAMKALITVERPRKPYPDIRKNKNTKTTNQQALLRWVLNNPHIDTIIPGMASFEHLSDDVAVMGTKLTSDDRRTLRRFSENVKRRYCCGIAGCTGCRDLCPKGVEVNEINRCINYAYGYGNIELARENYANLPESSRVDVCDECEKCVVNCVNGLDLRRNIQRAKELFA